MSTSLSELINPRDLYAEIEAGYITRKDHPTLPLSIYTYTRACQYERRWNPATMLCRGLVVHHSGRVIGRPFPKFFNVAEHEHGYDYAPPLPQHQPFEVFEKVDGSLGIVFHYDGKWHAASKGSFASEQAQWAQRWLDARNLEDLVPGLTYLVEIVYPENRIVVDNGDEHTLVLLAVMHPDGTEEPAWQPAHRDAWLGIGGRLVDSWPLPPKLPDLLRLAAENKKIDGTRATGTDAEGYVIRFSNGVRAKVISGWHLKFKDVDFRDSKTIEEIRDMRRRNGSWTLDRYRADICQVRRVRAPAQGAHRPDGPRRMARPCRTDRTCLPDRPAVGAVAAWLRHVRAAHYTLPRPSH
jgi:hypothetical protein